MTGPKPRISLRIAIPSLLSVVSLAAVNAHAQAVSFAGAQSTVGSDYASPYGVAVDNAGNLFVADSGNGRILEFPFGKSSGFEIPTNGLPTGQYASTAVGVDPFGNVFVVDTDNNRLLEVPAGSPYQNTLLNASGLSSPIGLAVIPGNVYIADEGNNRIVEVPTESRPETGVPITGLSSPYDVAVDSLGDLLIADWGNNRVIRYSPTTASIDVIASGLSGPQGVAVDAGGNVFITDSGNNQVLMLSGGGGKPFAIGSGFSIPSDLAVDAADSLYVADSGNNRIVQLQLQSVNFGQFGICTAEQTAPQSCGRLMTLSYNVTASGTLGPAVARTVGAIGLDFSVSNTGTCIPGAVTEGAQCTVDVVFAPRVAGLRKGAIEITDSNGKVLATTYVSGFGLGPQIAYGPGATATVGSGLNQAMGLATDESGDLYVADSVNNRVVRIDSKGVQSTVGSGFDKPAAVALDGEGNLFVADSGNNRVAKVPANGSAQSVIAEGLGGPESIAVDAAGNVYVADTGNNRVLKIFVSGGDPIEVGSGLSSPRGVVVDYTGNVFIADFGNQRVVEIPAVCGTLCQTALSTGFSGPQQMILDAAGDLLVADAAADRVVEIPADGSSPRSIGSNLKAPQGIAMDPAGNLYISQLSQKALVKLSRSAVPRIAFPTRTLVNTRDATDGPQTVVLENIGNQPLNFVTASYSSGFPSNTADTNLCDAGLNLQPGATCDVSVEFDPVFGGVNSGFVLITDNALNEPSATQRIVLSGTGFQNQTINFAAITGTEYALGKLSLKATASSGLAVVFASTSPKVCTVSSASAKLLAGGTCTIVASQPGNVAYAAAQKVTRSFKVLRASQSIAFPAITAQEHALTTLKLRATASSGLAVSFASKTTKVCTVASGVATLHAIGTCSISASQVGNAVYDPAALVSRSVKVLGAAQAITFATIADQRVGNKVALKATASSKLSIVFASATPAVCKVSGASATMLAAGTCNLIASQSGNQVYAPAAPAKRSFEVTK